MNRCEKCLVCEVPSERGPVCPRCRQDPFVMEAARKQAARLGLDQILETLYEPGYAFLREGNVKALWDDNLGHHKDTIPEFTAWRNQVSVAMITPPPRKLLEIGIGAGHAINYLSQRFPEADLYGIDVSEQAVRHVASGFRGNFAVGTIENLAWGDIQFDAILLLEDLEHIQVTRTFRVLRAVRAKLADKGTLILSVPLESVEELRGSYSVCPHCGYQVHPIGHIRSYSELEPIRTELTLSGLEIESMLGLAGGSYFGIPRQWLMHFSPARVKPMVMIFRCRRGRT